MKILLISPYSDISTLGLRIISAYLKRAGHSTRMIFLPYLYPEIESMVDFQHRYTPEILNSVSELAQDVQLIGITVMTNYFTMVEDLTHHLKRTTGVPVIWGGVHPSIRPEECLHIADFVCVSEGEATIVELADRLAADEAIDDIPNLWLKRNGELIRNPARSVIEDLDSLPYPDYDFNDQFVLDWQTEELKKLDKELLHQFLTRERPTKARAALFYQTIASRGCPYGCTFCCWNVLRRKHKLPRTIRRRSNQHLIGELKWVRQELPYIREITFSDDSFFAATLDEARQFRDLYKAEINLPFQCLAEPRTITREKMEIFVDAGMANIQIGIQTGSPSVKKMYGRPQKNKEIIAMGELLHEFLPRIRPPIYDFILDNPWETVDDKIETLSLLTRLPRPYFLQLFSLVFYPGTALYDRAMKEGLIINEREEIYNQQYNTRKINYVNLLFSLFSRNVPTSLLRYLSKSDVVKTLNKPSINALLRVLYKIFSRLRVIPLLVRRALKQQKLEKLRN
ncbi:B12-binding domain-containing radical SAM protein [candidate division CSSED10-310 bacterium]|uniref:B12-binding domain-containing radical SAM protein n=1 Tax=candidate division CSSED10-310 bacterium TaxID=2855610 RepID=A0ABV6Z0Q8_UNCC1